MDGPVQASPEIFGVSSHQDFAVFGLATCKLILLRDFNFFLRVLALISRLDGGCELFSAVSSLYPQNSQTSAIKAL